MHYSLGQYSLRKPEAEDVEPLYAQKNNPEVASFLGGFSTGYSKIDLRNWIEYHRGNRDEVLWVIANETNQAVGHVGLYRIDHRTRSAEFAIMLGEPSTWHKGLGRAASLKMVDYGFTELNLHRIYLEVHENNPRAHKLYQSLGFVDEGRLRQALYKSGKYLDVFVMGLLRTEYDTWQARLPEDKTR